MDLYAKHSEDEMRLGFTSSAWRYHRFFFRIVGNHSTGFLSSFLNFSAAFHGLPVLVRVIETAVALTYYYIVC